MICTSCNNVGIYSELSGKSYYYCRTCKDEINLTLVKDERSLEFAKYLNTDFGIATLVEYPIILKNINQALTLFIKTNPKIKISIIFLPVEIYNNLVIELSHRIQFITVTSYCNLQTVDGIQMCDGYGTFIVLSNKDIAIDHIAYTLD